MTVEVLKPAFQREKSHQHARGGERLPIRLELAGRAYVVSDLAEDGSAVVEFDGRVEPGQIVQTVLVIALDGYDLSMPALWEVVSLVPERAKLRLRLADANPPAHHARISSLIAAILAGDLVGSSDMLEIAGRKPAATAEPAPVVADHPSARSAISEAIRRRIGGVLFLLLATVLLAFIAASVAARALVIQADGTIINAQSVLARTPDSAELVSFPVAVGARVRPGNPVAIVKTQAGQFITVASPCDCIVGGQLAAGRAVVAKHDPLVQLVPVGGANQALVSVPRESLRRVRVGDRVTATFYDSSAKVTGTVERVSPPKNLSGSAGQAASANGTIEVRFAEKLPAWRVGEPVIARVLLSRFNPFA